MAINENAVLVIDQGTLFFAPAETPLPEGGVGQFRLDVDTLGEWTNMGDLSNDNKVSFSLDGGDPTTLATWRRKNARTTYATTTLTLTGNSVQLDAKSLKFVYNGWDAGDGGVVGSLTKTEQKLAIFVLGYDSGSDKYFGIYLPNTSFTWSNLPDLSADNFTEVSFTASVLDSSTLPANPDTGKKGTYAYYDSTAFAGASISVAPATADVLVDGTVDLTVAVTPEGAAFTAKSSDETKATVAVNGAKVTVTGKAATDAGKPVTVTVATKDETATAQVTVNPKA